MSIEVPEYAKNLSLEEMRERYGRSKPDENSVKIDGVNHVAFVCSDMAKTIWFWSEALGLKLTKTIALPGGGQHFFLDGGRGAAIAYFYFPDAPKATPGVSSVDIEKLITTGSFSTAVGSVNHVAFNVAEAELYKYREKIQEIGSIVTPMLFHTDETESGFSPRKDDSTTWMSFYFTGPDGEYLELTSQTSRGFKADTDINHLPARPSGNVKSKL